MKLTPSRLKQFDRDGHLFSPGLLTPGETAGFRCSTCWARRCTCTSSRHKMGVVDAEHDLTTTSYPLWAVDPALITQLAARAGGKHGGIVSPTGPLVR